MTVARKTYAELLDLAAGLGCVGDEVRIDLGQPLFDGIDPASAGAMARDKGLHILALAEVKRFNDWSSDKAQEARALMGVAQTAGAQAVSLIPRNDNLGLNEGERQANLRVALRELLPMLRDHGLKGLVEPLGFETCALRQKREAVDAIRALDATDTIQIVHDTFHHHLAGGGDVFPEQTGIIHVSGVVDPALAIGEMTDAHRVLVDASDRLGNVVQLNNLIEHGYTGAVSFEAFASDIHSIASPASALGASMDFMRSSLTAHAA